MNNINPQKPVVLVFAGHDPSGGAGIQADIESISIAGCHPATIITTLTQQNSMIIEGHQTQNASDFNKQARLILQDMEIKAFKIGVIGDEKLLNLIVDLLEEYHDIPVVLDPVLSSGTGYNFTNDRFCKTLIEKLFPLTTITTPNSYEARQLSNTAGTLDMAAEQLLLSGCKHVLITGTHENTEKVINILYKNNNAPIRYEFERLAGEYHGSGCTLSSSIAAYISLGYEIEVAVSEALTFTWESLKHGTKTGHGKIYPNRYYQYINKH